MKVLVITVLMWVIPLYFLSPEAYSQPHGSHSKKDHSLPLVFQLGEYDDEYETTLPEYVTLLDASNGDMKAAYNKLIAMMQEMETYSALVKYDLKGIHTWMHFFWRKDGSIEHIGFHLKPNSRNVDTEGFRRFLENFARQYKLPLYSDTKYSHYSSFSFPIISLRKKSADPDKSTARNIGHSGY
jgi:hypothetical protein